jgi:hypothetical protein
METLNKLWEFAHSVAAILAGIILSCFAWWEALPAETVKYYTPFGIIVVGLIGTLIAYRTVLVNRAIARRRSSIDVFIKTQMDQPMIDAYIAFRTASAALANQPDINAFAETPDYHAMRAYLDIHELIAVGIYNGTLDRKVCHRYWGDILTVVFRDARRVIEHAKSQPSGKDTYSNLERLNNNWSTPKWRRWMRFGH